jgi:uncharacterized damage-inducible protein DinB
MNVSEIQHLYAYTEWANALVLDAAEKLPAEQLLRDVHISHNSILGTLAHMAGAEWIWLERWHGVSPVGPEAWAQWKTEQCGNLQQLRAKWQPLLNKRHAYLERLKEPDLPKQLSFKRLNGDLHALPLVQQLQHVVNHATLHRGQVVGMIRQLGVTPPATDLLWYVMTQSK